MKSPKEQRFQLFLHELHDQTCEATKASGRTLSSEVRHRVKASFEMDANAAKLAELREWFGDTLWEDHDQAELREDLIAIHYILNKPHASPSAQKAE